MISFVNSTASLFLDSVLAIVYPQACHVCNQSVENRHDGVACAACWAAAALFAEDETLCGKCGAPSVTHLKSAAPQAIRCGRCDDDSFTVARACGAYTGALRATILELKRRPALAPRVGALLRQLQLSAPLRAADIIIAVPLHESRERERGFNQAHLLARELAKLSGLPLAEHAIYRRLHTERHRGGMDAKARRESVADAFVVRHQHSVAGKRVLLLDDVLTTGATVSACARVLKDAGAGDIYVLTLARAVFL